MPGFYLRGAFIQFMPTFLVPLPNVIMFQYNPERMTHTWKPSAPVVSEAGNKSNPLAVQSLPAESFSFTLAMDSNDTIADGLATAPLAEATGLYSRLCALEMLLYPTGAFSSTQLVGTVSSALSSAASGSVPAQENDVPQYMTPTVLFIWGPGRIVPVRITGLTITETLYDATLLNPIHAEAQVSFDVLTPDEVTTLQDALSEVATVAYTYSQGFRQAMALANLANTVESVLGMLPFG
jgi:hypothetical protein